MSDSRSDITPPHHGLSPESGSERAATSSGMAGEPPSRDRRATDAADRKGRHRPTDRILNLLLLEAERNGRTGITVTVGSLTMTGTLIGTLAFCREMADRFATPIGGTEMDAAFAEAFRSLVDDARDVAQGDRREPADPAAYQEAAEFLHLIDARYVTPAGILPLGRNGVLWRCRVADVTGWSLGDLMPPAHT